MAEDHKNVRCRMGKHHYVGVTDDSPEMRGQGHGECTCCGHVKDIDSYDKLSIRGATGQGIGFG